MFCNSINPYKSLFFVFCFFAALSAKANGIADSAIKKNGTFLNSSLINTYNTISIFKDAQQVLRQDSIAKGMKMLLTFLKNPEAEKKVILSMDYRGMELCNIILESDKNSLNVKDKQLIQDFIVAVLLRKNEDTFKSIEARLKGMQSVPLADRLRLYFMSITASKQVGKEADKILKDNPDMLSVNTLKTEWLYDNSKFEECMQGCNKIIGLSPTYAHAYELRGNTYARQDKAKNALDDLNQAVKLSPQNNVLNYELACVQMSLEKYKDAVPNFNKMKTAVPDYLWVNYNLAKCYNELKITDSAQFYVNLHIKQYPNDDEGYDLKGNIIASLSNFAGAIELYNKAIKIDAARPDFYEDRGDALYYSDKYKDAITDFEKALSLNKHRSYPADRIGDCYFQLKDFGRAMTAHQQAIKIDPTNKDAYVGVSMDKVELNDYKGAIEFCKKAIAIDSTFDNALSTLGWIYYSSGENDECINYSTKALHFNEKSTYAMFNIALATLRKGDVQQAKDLYSGFINMCKEKGYAYGDGPIDDLRDLIRYNMFVPDCSYIITELFKRELWPKDHQ